MQSVLFNFDQTPPAVSGQPAIQTLQIEVEIGIASFSPDKHSLPKPPLQLSRSGKGKKGEKAKKTDYLDMIRKPPRVLLSFVSILVLN